MLLVVMIVMTLIYHLALKPTPPPPRPRKPRVKRKPRWRFEMGGKKPPIIIEAPDEGLAVMALIKKGIDYQTVKSFARI